MSESADAIVIGAGPAGLAAAKCLADLGLHPVVLEKADTVGSVWRNHYDRLHLHTPRRLSALPGLAIPAATGRYTSRADVVAYLEAYAKAFTIMPRLATEVLAIEKNTTGWRIETTRQSLISPVVIVATGSASFPNRPALKGEEFFSGSVIHSSQYRNPGPFKGKRVLVVGFGNSGAEIALDLAEHNVDVGLSVRSPVNILPRELFGISILNFAIAESALPPRVADLLNAPLLRLVLGRPETLGLRPASKGALQMIAEHGKIPVLDVGTCAMIRSGKIKIYSGLESLETTTANFAGNVCSAFDAIILATGYRNHFHALFAKIPELFDGAGVPLHSDGRAAAAGLYFLGARPVATGQLREIARGARRIARSVKASLTSARQ